MSRKVTNIVFINTYNIASVSERQEVIKLIEKLDVLAVDNWVKRIRRDSLDLLSIRELRAICRELKIPFYTTLTKPLLLSEITKRL